MVRLWSNLLPMRKTAPSTPEGSSTARAVGGSYAAVTIGNGADVDQAVSRHYERVLWVFKCVDSIATKLSELNIVFRNEPDLESQEVIDYDLDRILNREANQYETGQAFRYRVISLALLSPLGVFIEKTKSASGGVSQLHVLPPGRVEPIPDAENYVKGYWVNNGVDGRDWLWPDQVLWIKLKPHPTDPYRQMTPLMAAGLAADTDWLARVYNRNFLARDGRPGMLITVQDLQPDDADLLRSRFSGGAANAGAVSIIEGAGIDIADMSTNPRDVMWAEALDGSRDDILAAFGVPMIAFGSSNEKTFDNADAESVSYWTETLVPTGNTLGRAYDRITAGGISDNVYVIHDTSKIYALQQVVREKKADLAAEVAAGLRTINSYLEETGQDRLPFPECDLLWYPGMGTIPIGDANAVKAVMEKLAQTSESINGPIQQQPGATAQSAVAPPRKTVSIRQLPNNNDGNVNLRQLSSTVNAQGNTLRQLSKGVSRVPELGGSRIVKRPRAHKADSDNSTDKESDTVVQDSRKTLEDIGVVAVTAWADRLVKESADRLLFVKTRKGTRHWEDATQIKVAPRRVLDADYVVQPDKWRDQLRDVLTPVLRKIVESEARQMITQYGIGDDVDVSGVVAALSNRVVNEAITQTDVLRRIVGEAEQRGDDIATIKDRVIKGGRGRSWVRPFVAEVVTHATEGARQQVAQRIGGMHKTWRTAGDERVRDSHRRLNGKTIRVDRAFNVNGARLRYPGDPLAPIGETINCRCELSYHL